MNSCFGKIFSLYFYSCFIRTLSFLVLYRPNMVEDDQSKDESLDEDSVTVSLFCLSRLQWYDEQDYPNYSKMISDNSDSVWASLNPNYIEKSKFV